MSEAIQIRLETIINQELSEQGVELVDLVVKGHRNNPLIQLFVDHPGGTTIQLCADLSRQVRDAIDREMADLNNYRLEVSSPGLDRSLKTKKDFIRHIGQMVEIYCFNGEKRTQISGKIESADDRDVILIHDDERIPVAIESIEKAKIKLKW
jgi:ribosome maturation factor RimP